MAAVEAPDLPLAALQLARSVPETVALGVAAAIERQDMATSPGARGRVVAEVAQPPYRAAVSRFLADWAALKHALPPVAVAAALRTAVRAVAVQREESATELVWTGPNPDALPLRRTDQALLELIEAARHTLTIVTFAAYKVPAIAAALVGAAQRGVYLRVIIESPQASDGKFAFDALDALGPSVAAMAAVYIWPLNQRPVDQNGRHGSLHVKCAVADDNMLFVSSANLTEYALTLNMELGILVRGGPIPGKVTDHFNHLIDRGVIKLIPAQCGNGW